MFVLLYINSLGESDYIQASSIESLNDSLRTLWEDQDIDREMWADDNYKLLRIDNGALTPINVWNSVMVPQITGA